MKLREFKHNYGARDRVLTLLLLESAEPILHRYRLGGRPASHFDGQQAWFFLLLAETSVSGRKEPQRQTVAGLISTSYGQRRRTRTSLKLEPL